MKLKTNLHFHAHDDTEDNIPYSFQEGILRAETLGFQCMTLTCHNTFVNIPEYHAFARAHDILFIPGIERSIEKRHVVILNPHEDVLRVRTFADLASYREEHKDIFVMAPHPYLPSKYSLHDSLVQHINLFDAVEQSWFYSKLININTPAARVARAHALPLIATSDTHDLRFLDTSYAVIDVKEKTIQSVFESLRAGTFENVATPRSFLFEMVPYILTHLYANATHPRAH
jgi:predicted metal-dependent phosphoesterase TrpH